MLEEDGADAKGSRIIIYTDGDENIVPTVDEVMPEIIAKGIIVDAILISPQASDFLKILAAQTGRTIILRMKEFNTIRVWCAESEHLVVYCGDKATRRIIHRYPCIGFGRSVVAIDCELTSYIIY